MPLGGTAAQLRALLQIAVWRDGLDGAAMYLSLSLLGERRAGSRRSRREDADLAEGAASGGETLDCVACAGSLTCDDQVALQTALGAYRGWPDDTAADGFAGLCISRRGGPLGALVVKSSIDLSRSEMERHVLRPIARLAASLLAERSALRELSRQAALLRALDEVGAAVEWSTSDDSILEGIFEASVQALKCDTASLFVLDRKEGTLRLVAGKNLPPGTEGRVFRLGEGLAGWAAAHGETVLVPDVRLDSRYQLPYSGLDAPRSLLVVPLRLYGEVIACLSFARRGTSAFHPSDTELAEKIAVYAAQALALARLTKLEAQEDVLRRRFETLSAASHDIRSELSQIKLVAKLAQHAQQSDDREAYLGQLIARVDGVSAILNAGLVAARLETELSRLQTERLGLVTLVEEVVEDAGLTGEANRRIEVEIPSEIEVTADRLQLRRVLANLLDNALKYSPPDSLVRLEASPRGEGVRISVLDQGRGVPPQEQARIFEPFHRVAGQSGAPGFGLGLYVCWRIVEAHGGRISVESQPGQGSTFHVDLPS